MAVDQALLVFGSVTAANELRLIAPTISLSLFSNEA
jgi:hypothetical protein